MNNKKSIFNSLSTRLLMIIIILLVISFAGIVIFVTKINYESSYNQQKEYMSSIADGTVTALT